MISDVPPRGFTLLRLVCRHSDDVCAFGTGSRIISARPFVDDEHLLELWVLVPR